MTFSRVTLVLSLLAAASLPACAGAPSASGEDSSEAAQTASDSRPNRQTILYLSEATLQRSIDAFRARNGTGWQPKSAYPRLNTNGLTGSVSDMVRRDPYGPDVNLDAAGTIATTRTFLLRNADLLNVTAAELDASESSASFLGTVAPLSDYRWIVTFRKLLPLPGYEAFTDSLPKSIDISVSIARDGTPRNLSSHVSGFPGLSVSTVPAHAPDDPLMLGTVVGTELQWVVFGGTFTHPTTTVTPLGRVTMEDIVSKKLVIYLAASEDEVVLTLAYRYDVQRGGHMFLFFVDSRTGERLAGPG